MDGIRARALARGVVLEYGHTLAKSFHPIMAKAIPEIFGQHGIAEINSRRKKGGDLNRNITTWNISEVASTIFLNWSSEKHGSEFERYFRKNYARLNLNEFTSDLRDLRDFRDDAAHPEFAHAFTIEDAKNFLRAAERTARKLNVSNPDKYLSQIKSLDDLTMRDNIIFDHKYPDAYETEFASASELWITGTNLRRICTDTAYLSYIRGVLAAGGVVKVIMHHPEYDVCKYAMMQDGPGSDLDGYRQSIHEHLSEFCRIRATAERGANLKIRTIDYMLTFGLDIMNGADEVAGIVYVRSYPLPRKNEKKFDDKPIVRLTHNDARWYEFYIGQFQRHWNDAAHHGWAEEVPADYPWQTSEGVALSRAGL